MSEDLIQLSRKFVELSGELGADQSPDAQGP